VSTERLLESPHPRPTYITQPSADFATSAATRRQQEVKKRHMVSVCRRVNVLLTGRAPVLTGVDWGVKVRRGDRMGL